MIMKLVFNESLHRIFKIFQSLNCCSTEFEHYCITLCDKHLHECRYRIYIIISVVSSVLTAAQRHERVVKVNALRP